MTRWSEYLEFRREEPPGRKTPIVHVVSKSQGITLGRIAWYGPWRQFCFWPALDTVFNVTCMVDIQEQIAELRKERES